MPIIVHHAEMNTSLTVHVDDPLLIGQAGRVYALFQELAPLRQGQGSRPDVQCLSQFLFHLALQLHRQIVIHEAGLVYAVPASRSEEAKCLFRDLQLRGPRLHR